MAEGLLDKANIILTPTGYKAGTMYNVAPIEQPYEDFVFSRASVASRVNSSGLVEMVGRTLGSNLVQNGDFSEIGPDLVQNGTFDLGSELVRNGDFSDGTNHWINNASAILSIENDRLKVTVDGAGSGYGQQDIIGLTVGKTYQINAEGEIGTSTRLALYTPNAGFNNLYSDGTISTTFIATSTTENLRLYVYDDGAYGFWDNVSVKEVPYWSLGAKWSVEDNYARLISTTSAGSSLIQSNVFTVGKSYKITLDAIVTSGSAKLEGSGGSEVLRIDTTQSYTLYWSADITDIIFNRRSYTSDVKITNIVVQELDPNDYWNLETGWSLGDNQAIKTGSVASNFYQYSVFTTGQTYKLTFTISNSNDGRLLVYVGGNSVTEDITNTSDGTYTFYANSDNVNLVFRNVTFEGSITNVTAQEVIDTNNIPRINYDSNGENGHWLLEPTSTNLVTYSEDFTKWTLGINTTLTYESDVVAPDGSLGVYRLTNPATFNTFIQSPSFSSSNPLTVSLYVKSTGSGNDNFNFYTGASNVSDLKTATSEWQRFDYTADGSSMYIVNDGDTFTSDIYIWGGQAEALSYSTSYIPTLTGSTETRATETATGAGSADLINSTEGVLYAEIAALADDGTFRVISINSGDNTNIVKFGYRTTSNAIYYEVRSGDVSQSFQIYTTTDVKEFHKVALLYKENDFKLFVDGVNVLSDTSGITPIGLNNLSFTLYSSASYYGKCKALAVFDEALTDAELTELTS